MEWNDEAIARLRALWDEGHSTAEIGRRMAVSKNAVVGKAHRLNLPARPSPIRRDATGAAPRPPAPRRVTGPTLPPLPAAAELVRAPQASEPAPVLAAAPIVVPQPAPVPQMRAPMPMPAPVLRPLPQPRSRNASCCWPIGEPGTKSFRFCDAEATPNKPYCNEHAQLAYVKVRDRRDEAAA
jgi:GcrA cell cycle regulator